ncbi:hypothetical protein A3F66_02895 [candidate division TM6 bacterium RIFCSPHIGHO2_12_FULL_32_22]|nr:MAG: hypothetical protein A3F66_02895 [candidate division TM6 bacterium RIFCSPHIGHO2_12_FULL_32_22]
MKKQLLSLNLLLSSMSFVCAEKPFEYYVELVKLCKKPSQNLITRIRCLERKTQGDKHSYDIPEDLVDEIYSLEYEKNREEIEAFINIISIDQLRKPIIYKWICSDINLVNIFLDRLNVSRISRDNIRLIILPGVLQSYIYNLNNQEMYYLLLSKLLKQLCNNNIWIEIDSSYFKKALSLKDNDPILKWLFQEGLIREHITPACSGKHI